MAANPRDRTFRAARPLAPGNAAMTTLTLTSLLIASVTAAFMILERVAPGRELPNAPGWYGRALIVTLCQVGLMLATGRLWRHHLGHASLLDLDAMGHPAIEGFIGWLVGTFFFYWWHRVRHLNGWWVLFHQVHHSPARIEAMTSFYKHPVEILADCALAVVVLYPLLGCSLEGAMWSAVFASTGEFFYHSNYKSPRWLKYFIQTPELHSLHHELDVHAGNYGDLPIWDRLFGTYRDTDDFAEQCGFPRDNERYLLRMLLFQDVYGRTQ
jgi:sterol desaturase/sphingolipid hydroxylase (fatty acid hydroxylase superfamily)